MSWPSLLFFVMYPWRFTLGNLRSHASNAIYHGKTAQLAPPCCCCCCTTVNNDAKASSRKICTLHKELVTEPYPRSLRSFYVCTSSLSVVETMLFAVKFKPDMRRARKIIPRVHFFLSIIPWNPRPECSRLPQV